MTIPPGLEAVPLQDYWTAHPQVVDSVHGPGFAADQARVDMMNAYNYAWAQEPTGYENEFSPILTGQTFLPGVCVPSFLAAVAADADFAAPSQLPLVRLDRPRCL